MKHQSLFFTIVFLFGFCICAFSQPIAAKFQEADKLGISMSRIEGEYKSAIHVDTAFAVFKSANAQEQMIAAYHKLVKDFGKYLSDNQFFWDKKTQCFNRIYFNENGSIDYFLFNFLGPADEKPSEERQKEFNRILNEFIKDYKISVTAAVKFSQCSPVIYMPKETKNE